MARASAPPARSIYFVFTTAEESGLLGSEYFAAHPPLPMAQFAANINVDEANPLGRTKDIALLGSDRSSLGQALAAIAAERGRVVGVDAHPDRGYFFRSDHFPLAKAGVPALSLTEPEQFEGPNAAALTAKQAAFNDKDYHQPSDQFDPAWDFSGAADDMKLLAALAWRIAAMPTMPAYNDGDQFAQVRKK
jgi:Zn-dependent M28 family amino/carboxypeptidase